MTSDLIGLIWLVVLLAGNAFFVAGEFAVLSARRSQIEPKAEAGSKRAKTALYAMEHVSQMLAVAQLGITVCSLLLLIVAEPAIHHLLAVPFEAAELPPAVTTTVSLVIALIIVSFLHVTFGEMVPKNFAVSVADRAVLLLAAPLVFLYKVLMPLIWLLNFMANLVLRAFRVRPRDEVISTFTLQEMETIVAESKRGGTVTDQAGIIAGGPGLHRPQRRGSDGAHRGADHRPRRRHPHPGGEGRRQNRVLPLRGDRRRRRLLRLPAPEGHHGPARSRCRVPGAGHRSALTGQHEPQRRASTPALRPCRPPDPIWRA